MFARCLPGDYPVRLSIQTPYNNANGVKANRVVCNNGVCLQFTHHSCVCVGQVMQIMPKHVPGLSSSMEVDEQPESRTPHKDTSVGGASHVENVNTAIRRASEDLDALKRFKVRQSQIIPPPLFFWGGGGFKIRCSPKLYLGYVLLSDPSTFGAGSQRSQRSQPKHVSNPV